MATLYDRKELPDAEIIAHVKEYYNQIKKDPKGRFQRTLSLFPDKEMRILDYGCGWGHYSYELFLRENIVTGIDLMPNEIDICKMVWEERSNLKYLTTDITTIKNNSYDAVLSAQVIEHVHNVGNYLTEISRVLDQDGYLVISLPNVMNPRFFLSLMNSKYEKKLLETSNYYLDEYKKQLHHVNSWDPFHFTILLASAGFKLVKYIGSEGIPLPNTRFLPNYLKGSLSNKVLKNYTYTMQFLFQKVQESNIKTID